jgi:hypothetical protein
MNFERLLAETLRESVVEPPPGLAERVLENVRRETLREKRKNRRRTILRQGALGLVAAALVIAVPFALWPFFTSRDNAESYQEAETLLDELSPVAGLPAPAAPVAPAPADAPADAPMDAPMSAADDAYAFREGSAPAGESVPAGSAAAEPEMTAKLEPDELVPEMSAQDTAMPVPTALPAADTNAGMTEVQRTAFAPLSERLTETSPPHSETFEDRNGDGYLDVVVTFADGTAAVYLWDEPTADFVREEPPEG